MDRYPPPTGADQIQRYNRPINADAVPQWEAFYNRAIAVRGMISDSQDEETLFKLDPALLETTELTYTFGFPEDKALDGACEALTGALWEASSKKLRYDTDEVKAALDNLEQAYDEAAKPNTVTVRYIDIEPPHAKHGPLRRPKVGGIEGALLAQQWMKELIGRFHAKDSSLRDSLLILGNPGSGKSVALVGYLLFYLIALGERVILQDMREEFDRSGFLFDEKGVREITAANFKTFDEFNDDRPCWLLVNADGKKTSPSLAFSFCNKEIVVSSPNIETKQDLKSWSNQEMPQRIISPSPPCYEVVWHVSHVHGYPSFLVYWMYHEWSNDFRRCLTYCQEAIESLAKGKFCAWYRTKVTYTKTLARKMLGEHGRAFDPGQTMVDNESNLSIPSALVTMEKFNGQDEQNEQDEEYNGQGEEYKIMLKNANISRIVAEVQGEEKRAYDLDALKLYFRNEDTRTAAGTLFQRMFERKLRNENPNKIRACYELVAQQSGLHPNSPHVKEADMPWKDFDQQPKLNPVSLHCISNIAKGELKVAIDTVMGQQESKRIVLVVPRARNWPTWDAAFFIRSNETEVHFVFLQMTTYAEHTLIATGLNLVRDLVSKNENSGKGLPGFAGPAMAPPNTPSVHYHYVLCLLVDELNEPTANIPSWKKVSGPSKKGEKKEKKEKGKKRKIGDTGAKVEKGEQGEQEKQEESVDDSWNQNNLRQYIMFVPVEDFRAKSKGIPGTT